MFGINFFLNWNYCFSDYDNLITDGKSWMFFKKQKGP